jgi:ArsR family transcriptional regulator, arsenate/arsenite/antimonite-responsive transcriptional repressor / arsenate reductase (thioredoxin)
LSKKTEHQDEALILLKLLAHDLRWAVVKSLATTDMRVGEIVAGVQQPTNLVSYHLKKLRDGNVVNAHRSNADARDVYYTLDFDRVREALKLVGKSVSLFSQGLPANLPVRIVFVCTDGSLRSRMAAAIAYKLNEQLEGNYIESYIGGLTLAPLHPETAHILRQLNLDVHHTPLRHIDEFNTDNVDFAITVCDQVRDMYPAFPPDLKRMHWSIPPPSPMQDPEARQEAYRETYKLIEDRIVYFIESLQRLTAVEDDDAAS